MTTEITTMELAETTMADVTLTEATMADVTLTDATLTEATLTETTPATAAEVAAPVPVKAKPITWETDRNAAAAALMRAGATPREVRVLASLGAQAAAALRQNARKGAADSTKLDDKAAESVLAAHRAAASPTWNI